jgi:hypothetical protein
MSAFLVKLGTADQTQCFHLKPGTGEGAIQGPFHQSLVAIGPVVSEEKIKM